MPDLRQVLSVLPNKLPFQSTITEVSSSNDTLANEANRMPSLNIAEDISRLVD